MKKLWSAVCILTAIAYQPAQAQSYYYEPVGQSAPEHVQIDGVRYARIPQVQKVSDYRLTREDEYVYEERRAMRNASQNYAFRPYVGFDVAGSKAKYGNLGTHEKAGMNSLLEDSYFSFNLAAGMRFNRYFGAELFFQQSAEEEKSHVYDDISNTLATKFNAYGIDFIGYIPLTQEVELLGALGFGNYDFNIKIKNDFQDILRQYITTAWRFGAGLQFNINEHWGLRFMGRYVHMLDNYMLKNMLEASLGVRYMF